MRNILWDPENSRHKPKDSPWLVQEFIDRVNNKSNSSISSISELYKWSVNNLEDFWLSFLDFSKIQITNKQGPTLIQEQGILGSRWFPEYQLNFAQNLLRFSSITPEKTAIEFWSEDKISSSVSYGQLLAQTKTLASYLESLGLETGDRVAAITPNCPQAIVAMLASTSQGYTWSSCSPDFGKGGILDRFGQIDARVLFVVDGYFYKGKFINILPVIEEILSELTTVEKVIVFSLDGNSPKSIPFNADTWVEIFDNQNISQFKFPALPFNHPLYIMFSSGTTGKPKCIVHGVGGTLLEHSKELKLHCNVTEHDIVFYGTTCGWMMWNWLVSALSCGATLALYDGFPLLNSGKILFEFAEQKRITVFGTSAGFLTAVGKLPFKPIEDFDLNNIRLILSTGSVLSPENFDLVYERFSKDVQLASISGGTDILGCFALGCPALPVVRGELQTRSFAYAVEVFNSNGESVVEEQGELVCTKPFPSMPIYFWNDPQNKRYKKAYFEKFPGVWCHGDYVKLLPSGGMIFYGRSDAVLNPGGVRIGSAEIYRQIEIRKEIDQAVVVGHSIGDDEEIVLFLKLFPDYSLTEKLKTELRQSIRSNASPRHVPKKIIAVKDIPITRSGKISELAVKKKIHGQSVDNKEALANPKSLDLFSPELLAVDGSE